MLSYNASCDLLILVSFQTCMCLLASVEHERRYGDRIYSFDIFKILTGWSHSVMSRAFGNVNSVCYYFMTLRMIYDGGVHGYSIRNCSQVRPKYCYKLVSCSGYKIPQTHHPQLDSSWGLTGDMPQ